MRMRRISAFLIIATFFIPALLIPAVMSAETMEKSVFMESKFVIHFTDDNAKNFWNKYKMLLNDSEFTAEVVIKPTNYSRELDKAELYISSYFMEKEGVEPAILVDGENVGYSNPLIVNNPANVNEIRIMLTAKTARDVRVRSPVTLIKVVQRTPEGEYLVENVGTNVSSWIVEEAIEKINAAKREIEEARKTLENMTLPDAERALRNADSQLRHAEELYMQGKPEEAKEEAENALGNAKIAREHAESARSAGDIMKYAVIAIIVIIAVIVALMWFIRRQRERGKLG